MSYGLGDTLRASYPMWDFVNKVMKTGQTTGLTITIYDGNGSLFGTYTLGTGVVELGATGVYICDFVSNVAGHWTCIWVCTVAACENHLVEVIPVVGLSSNAPGTPPPAGPVSKCRVFEYCPRPDGTFPSSVSNSAKVVSLPYDDGTSLFSGEEQEGVYDPSTGLLYWDVVYGAKVEFSIHDYGVREVKTVPSTPTIRLRDIT